MKNLLFVLVIGAIGYAAYHWGWQPYRAHHAAKATSPFAINSAPSAPGSPAAPGKQSPAEAPPASLPPALKAQLDMAEAAWTKASTGGANPSTSNQAPGLDEAYSGILRALYSIPGQDALQDRIVLTRLTPLGSAIFFSPTRYTDDPTGLLAVHVVAAGESPDRIAIHYGMSRELLNRMRGRDVNDADVHPGDAVKVVDVKTKGGYLIHISKSRFLLDVFVGGAFARRYPVSIGSKQAPTPVGTTHLTDRVWHPSWTDPEVHQVYPYGDVRDILGPAWLPCSPDGLGETGIGIHGYTGKDQGMGEFASSGCIRMRNPDITEVYDTLAHPGRAPTTVEIVP